MKDELAWARVLLLFEGIGVKTADKIVAQINSAATFEEAINLVLRNGFKQNKYHPALAKLADILEIIGNQQSSIPERVEKLLEYYAPILKNKFDDWNQRFNDLQAMQKIVDRYDSLEDLLAEFSIEPISATWQTTTAMNGQSTTVTLSTIHSAKGLEWDCVYLFGLIDGVLPISFSLNDPDRIEEEQRLFYVAITRAKKKLFLSANQEGNGMGNIGFNKVSRFLDSAEVLSKLNQDMHLDYEPI
jgi:DNA helicase-2/ATP-dependent DNA helicase PcrA